MNAQFQVKSIINQWKPPFEKKIKEDTFNVKEGQSFSQIKGKGQFVFKLLRITGKRALIEYHPEFTLKGHENPGNKQLWFDSGETKNFTFLWGEDGITKSITLQQTEA